MWEARQAIKHQSYFSVEVINPSDSRSYWVDIAIKNDDIEADWNQYIFFENNHEDIVRKEAQNNPENFDDATSVAICYLETLGQIVQTDTGERQIIK